MRMETGNATLERMHVASPSFENAARIPAHFTCDGANTSPAFALSDVPENAKSLALIVTDPDAPRETWTHWTAWNIDPKTDLVAENTIPPGSVQGVTSFGKPGYGGPCPPSGVHRYFFTFYALDAFLDIPATADRIGLEMAMQGHVIAKAEFMGTYGREQ